MDASKRAEIEEKVKNCRIKIANETAKLTRYEAQLANGKTGHTKPRAKDKQKQVKDALKPEQTPTKAPIKKGVLADFIDTILD